MSITFQNINAWNKFNKKHIIQIIYKKYTYPSTTFQKLGVFHPQPTPPNPPPAASPDPGVPNELPPTEWPGDDRRFGSWEAFFSGWEGEQIKMFRVTLVF